MHDESSESGWPRDMMVIVSALAALLIYFQYTTCFKFAVLEPGKRYSLGAFVRVVERYVPLNLADGILASLIISVFATIIILELWRKRLSALLKKVFETENRTLLALVIACLLCARYYFAKGGLAWTGDANFHIGYAWIASQAFSQGELPIWTNYYGTGSPYCQFYGFLFFYLTGAVDLLFSDLEFSLKFVMGISHVISGIGMYLLVRTLFNRQAGFVAAMAYVMCVWHTQQVLIMGRYPLSLFYALLPFPFYFFERLKGQTPELASAIAGGLTLGLLAFTHPGYAFWATLLFGLWVCTRLWIDRDRHGARAVCSHSILLLLGGLAFGAYLTLPMWMERGDTILKFGLDLSSLPDPTLGQLLNWSNYRFRLFPIEANHWYGGYLGLSVVALCLLGIVSWVPIWIRPKTRRRLASIQQGGIASDFVIDLPGIVYPAISCFIVSLLLVFGYRLPPLGQIDVVQAFNAGRYLLFVVFFLCVMVGAGAAALITFCRRRNKRIDIVAIMLLVMIVDLGPTTFQQPFISHSALERTYLVGTDGTNLLRDEAAQFPVGEIPNYRVFFATDTAYRPFSISYLSINTTIVTFLGLFNETLLATHVFCHPFEKLLNSEIRKAEKLKSPGTHDFRSLNDGLYLLNSKRVMAAHSNKKSLITWTIPGSSPVVVSSKVEGWDLPVTSGTESEAQSALMRLVTGMGINQEKNSCDRILLAGFKGVEDLDTSPSVQVLEHRTWNQRVEIIVRTSSSCFARLAYAYSPYLSVTVNSKKVVPYQTSGRFIAVRLNEGEHHIVLEPVLSPLRRGLLMVNLTLVAACLVYFGWKVRERLPPVSILKRKDRFKAQ